MTLEPHEIWLVKEILHRNQNQVLIAKRLLIPNHVTKSEPAQIDYTEKETRTFREGGGDSRPMAAISTHG
jgi:hypothetical protein